MPGSPIEVNFPEVDWSKLIPTLVDLFFTGIGTWLQKSIHTTFDGLWGGGTNVLTQTDLGMTWNLGPVAGQMAEMQGAARAVLLFAVILLGIKSMLGGIVTRHHDTLGEAVNGVLMSVVLVTAFPLVIPLVIGLTNQAAAAVGGAASLSAYVSAASGPPDPLIGGVMLVILLFFALRLLIKSVWRIGFLAVLLPVGVVACALHAVPQLRWILTWWARTWGGMLVAQIPAVFALSVGVGLFANGGGGIGPFVYSIAFLQLATDLYGLIPFGHTSGGGAPWGALPWRAAAGAVGLGGAAAAATVAASIPPNRVTTVADQYGYQ